MGTACPALREFAECNMKYQDQASMHSNWLDLTSKTCSTTPWRPRKNARSSRSNAEDQISCPETTIQRFPTWLDVDEFPSKKKENCKETQPILEVKTSFHQTFSGQGTRSSVVTGCYQKTDLNPSETTGCTFSACSNFSWWNITAWNESKMKGQPVESARNINEHNMSPRWNTYNCELRSVWQYFFLKPILMRNARQLPTEQFVFRVGSWHFAQLSPMPEIRLCQHKKVDYNRVPSYNTRNERKQLNSLKEQICKAMF